MTENIVQQLFRNIIQDVPDIIYLHCYIIDPCARLFKSIAQMRDRL